MHVNIINNLRALARVYNLGSIHLNPIIEVFLEV